MRKGGWGKASRVEEGGHLGGCSGSGLGREEFSSSVGWGQISP